VLMVVAWGGKWVAGEPGPPAASPAASWVTPAQN
jgi:hypothetical protein